MPPATVVCTALVSARSGPVGTSSNTVRPVCAAMPRPRNNAPHGSCWPSNGSRLGPTESNTGSPCATNRRATESNARSRGDSSTESRSAGGTMIHTMVVPAATAGCGPSAGVHSRTSKRAPRGEVAAVGRGSKNSKRTSVYKDRHGWLANFERAQCGRNGLLPAESAVKGN